MKKIICILIALWTCVCASAKTYWCSPDGFSDGSSYDRAGSFTVLVSGLAAGDTDPVADVNTNPQNIGQIINSKQSIMIEKKKNYLTPLMKVVKVQNAQIICGSQQNESYIEGSAGSWYD